MKEFTKAWRDFRCGQFKLNLGLTKEDQGKLWDKLPCLFKADATQVTNETPGGIIKDIYGLGEWWSLCVGG